MKYIGACYDPLSTLSIILRDDERIQFLLDGVTEAYSYNMTKKLNKAKRVKKPNVPPPQDIAAAPPTEDKVSTKYVLLL